MRASQSPEDFIYSLSQQISNGVDISDVTEGGRHIFLKRMVNDIIEYIPLTLTIPGETRDQKIVHQLPLRNDMVVDLSNQSPKVN